jgi:4-diphosphocytidyl-2-C-methyl-D-erythritol kinase
VRVRSYAKINWSLRITGKRGDGYHDLETIFQLISLHDMMTFERAERMTLTCDDPTIPLDQSNLVLRAARALGNPPVKIELRKSIPSGGGLGGGSSNAATTLRVLDEMFELGTPPERMREIALALGSDVPFFLLGGTAYARGRGEILTTMPPISGVPLLLVLPDERVSTAEAFRLIAKHSQPIGIPRETLFARPELLVNDFEEPIFAKLPRLRDYKKALLEAGALWAGMSGSGSTIAGAFETAAERDAATDTIRGVTTARAETIAAV